MEEDKHRFGSAAWASAAPRLEKLRFLLAKETLQHMRTTEMCLNRKKDGIREKVCACLVLFRGARRAASLVAVLLVSLYYVTVLRLRLSFQTFISINKSGDAFCRGCDSVET